MDPRADLPRLPRLLARAQEAALAFREGLAARPAVAAPASMAPLPLPEEGLGGEAALELFRARYEAGLSGSAGPRYLGFVTGGSSAAALAGDWLAAAYDQNLSHDGGSSAAEAERETLAWLGGLFGLGPRFRGCFVTGATQANLVGLAAARQWAGRRLGRDLAEEGLGGIEIPVFAASPHASIPKALAILGLGRKALRAVATLPGSEAADLESLDRTLAAWTGSPAILVASAGTVNSGAFDDLEGMARLAERHGAWLHVDGAFGLFAAASPCLASRLKGLEAAHSIATDGHKWLNLPYDSGLAFVAEPEHQYEVFRAAAPYLSAELDPLHFTPENSRRFRALPAWMALAAYGREGVRCIVERCCGLAAKLGAWIEGSDRYELLAPVGLNIVAFAPRHADRDRVLDFLARDGRAFLTPTLLQGRPAIRAAFSNAHTSEADLELVIAALEAAAQEAA